VSRILVVDDEPLIALMVEEWLVELGHQVVGPAFDNKRGLSLVDDSLDAAILDVSSGRNRPIPLLTPCRNGAFLSPLLRVMEKA
jgi:DNA-binding response OmpR family regulator